MREFLVVLTLAVEIFAVAMLRPSQAAGPSFDCARATAPDEFAICADERLMQMDNLTAVGFNYLKRRYGSANAVRTAAPLLKTRQACGSDRDCILRAQLQAVQVFRSLGAPIAPPDWAQQGNISANEENQALPIAVGQCARSFITQIGGRLEGDGDFSSGTSVTFANGGSQVSYDKEQAIIRSRAGDPVSVCLVELPKDCPPGDDRGKVYKTTNERTGEAWVLPDSEHMCGGA
jgi:uncharacterized protein